MSRYIKLPEPATRRYTLEIKFGGDLAGETISASWLTDEWDRPVERGMLANHFFNELEKRADALIAEIERKTALGEIE